MRPTVIELTQGGVASTAKDSSGRPVLFKPFAEATLHTAALSPDIRVWAREEGSAVRLPVKSRYDFPQQVRSPSRALGGIQLTFAGH